MHYSKKWSFIVECGLDSSKKEQDMSFDHDASMRRSAERKKVVEDVFRKSYDFAVESAGSGHSLQTWFAELHIAFLTTLLGGSTHPAMIASRERDIREFVFGRMAEIKAFAPVQQEWHTMALSVSRNLLTSATSSVIDDFNSWESKAFQEKG
jgi:hypothetical protein